MIMRKIIKNISWISFAFIWINVGFMIYDMSVGLSIGSWELVWIGFLKHLPWILTFWWMYKSDKLDEKLDRYRELYGELPKETPESEKQNSENP